MKKGPSTLIHYLAIKTNIADSLNVIVQTERRPGSRSVSEVLEIQGYNAEDDRYHLDTKFNRLEETSPGSHGRPWPFRSGRYVYVSFPE
jgi:Flp pilus assembly CpaF family ATPase